MSLQKDKEHMKHLSVSIPEKEYDFFLKLIKNLSFVKVESVDYEISTKEKNLVRKRIKNTGNGKVKGWDDVKDSFTLD
jgi:hypothetical protein